MTARKAVIEREELIRTVTWFSFPASPRQRRLNLFGVKEDGSRSCLGQVWSHSYSKRRVDEHEKKYVSYEVEEWPG